MGMKRIGRTAPSLLFISLLSIVAAELTLRVYNNFNPISIFYSDSYKRFRPRPFADDFDFKFNSRGFKDVEFGPKRRDVYRILGIGDSFVYGVVPYKYNYLTLLESQLNAQHGRVEVLNMGIPGIGPREYLALFVREGLALDPDMVLLSFYVGNDFLESDRTSQRRKQYSYSYVASLLYYLVNVRPKYEGAVYFGKGDYCDECPAYPQDAYLQIVKERSGIYVKGDAQLTRLLDDALFHLGQIRDLCRKKGIEFFVVIAPDEIQFNRALETEVRTTFFAGVTANDWDRTLPNTSLARALGSVGIDHLDLYQHFATESERRQVYRPRDTHWNIVGNQLAADVIQSRLGQYIRRRASLQGMPG